MPTCIKVKKLRPDAQLPTRAHVDDLGFDLYAVEDTVLPYGKVTRVSTGVAVEAEGYGFEVADRSSLSMLGIKVVGGKIDGGYRGEMFVNLLYVGHGDAMLAKGERVAQMIPRRIEDFFVQESAELSEGTRGDAGYGSTGR